MIIHKPQYEIVTEVLAERDRQDGIYGANRFLPHGTWLTILIEEIGEVARAMQEDDENIETELVQVAAVAIAWLEDMNKTPEFPVD